jgi:DNA-binding response OmpR family regulator
MERKAYPSDISDEEWGFMALYLTLMTEEAPQRDYSLREVFNGLRWLVRAGASWRMIPHDLPPWWVVYQQTQRWIKAGVFEAWFMTYAPSYAWHSSLITPSIVIITCYPISNSRNLPMLSILFVEDDTTIAMGVEYSLKQDGFQVSLAYRLEEARDLLKRSPFDLVLLDLGLPDGSGYELCKEIRAAGDTPIIILSARDEEASIVLGLDLGADDYLTKPFRLRELISRMKAVLRRRGPVEASDRTFTCGDVTVVTQQAKVYKNGRDVILTALEYRLLLALVANQGRVLSRAQILAQIWDVDENFVNDNTLTVYIKRLREKLEDDPQNPALIKTVRGLGYKAGD